MDGFLCAELLNRYNDSKIVGTYDKNILCISDGVSVDECLFVDCDMNRDNLVSIGNHMRRIGDSMSDKSFNPNVHYGITTYTDKFPYATVFLVADAIEIQTSEQDHIRMAYADSTLKNMESYASNMRVWSDRMNHESISYIIENSDIAKSADIKFRELNPNQSMTSKRYGKKRYIEALNKAFEDLSMNFAPLVIGKKYLADKVGLNTVIRYNRDILSYAEVYGGEYSVTYDQEIEWK